MSDTETKNGNHDVSPNASQKISEKDVMKCLYDLAQYNKVVRQFSLIREYRSENNQPMFEVRLSLGDEIYTADGRSIRNAQRTAAAIALEKTKFAKPQTDIVNRHESPANDKDNTPIAQTMEYRSPYDPATSRYFEKRLDQINAPDDQLDKMKFILSELEKYLKEVSDKLTIRAKETGTQILKTYQDPANPSGKKPDDEYRILKGVMRVGNMAKNVILRNDVEVDLVLLCACKPTLSLLHEVCSELQSLVENFCFVAEEEYARIRVEYGSYQARIFISSIVFRQENFDDQVVPDPDPVDVLPRDKCLQALAEVRHAKWFQATFIYRKNSIKTLRLLRDLAIRRPKPWAEVPQWALELLLDHCATAMIRNPPISWIFRKILEILASGILYDSSLGIFDPCEKEVSNAIANVCIETRDLLTAEAQYFLRLLAFRRAWDILDMPKIDGEN